MNVLLVSVRLLVDWVLVTEEVVESVDLVKVVIEDVVAVADFEVVAEREVLERVSEVLDKVRLVEGVWVLLRLLEVLSVVVWDLLLLVVAVLVMVIVLE